MNKYDKLFREILSLTRDGTLKWKLLTRAANDHIIFNPMLVFRQFEARMLKSDETYKLLFVEKKSVDAEYDGLEKYSPELLVLHDGELIVTLTDSVIERSELVRLLELIEPKSDKARKLFGEEES
jgi:hypothetical protein